MIRLAITTIIGILWGSQMSIALEGPKDPPKKSRSKSTKKTSSKRKTKAAVPVKKEEAPPPTKIEEKPKSEPAPPPKPYPPIPVDAKIKTLLIDARRLKDHKLTETIRYMQNNKEVRFKLQNMTIDPTFAVPLLKELEGAKVLEQIKDIGFVMLRTAHGQVLNESEFIAKILPLIKHLEGLELNCLGVKDTVVKVICQQMPSLTKLSLFGRGVTDTTIQTLIETRPNLEKLQLASTSLTAKGLQDIIKSFKKLRALGVSGENLKDKDFIAMGESIKLRDNELHTLSLVGQEFKDMGTLNTLLSKMSYLHTLDLAETNANDAVAEVIVNEMSRLKSLDISDTKITKIGLDKLAQHLDLTTLKINGLKGIGNEELKLIADKQPGLRKFYFAGTDFNEATLVNIIFKMPRLVDITLIPIVNSQWALTDCVAETLVLKDEKDRLQYLHIQANRLPDAIRAKLEKEIPNLRIEYAA